MRRYDAKPKGRASALVQTGIPLLLWTVFSPDPAWSAVNARTAAYEKTWIDWTGQQSTPLLIRAYSSRSLFKGHLGLGWCTGFDHKLRFVSDRDIEIADCDKTDLFRRQEVAGVTDRNVARVDSQSPTYASMVDPRRVLYVQGSRYLLREPSGERREFDRRGRLISYGGIGEPPIRVHYDAKGRPWRIERAAGESIRLVFDDRTNLLNRAIVESGPAFTYAYDSGRLAEVRRDSEIIFRGAYDEVHNLIRATGPSRRSELIRYDAEHDRVAAWQTPDGCTRIYRYTTDPQNETGSPFTVRIESQCERGASRAITHEFHFTKERNRSRPERHVIRQGGRRWIQTFDARGNLIARSGPRFELEFRERADGGLELEVRSTQSPKVHLATFHWLGDRRLVHARFRGGIEVRIDSDALGRLQAVETSDGRAARFVYTGSSRQPDRVQSTPRPETAVDLLRLIDPNRFLESEFELKQGGEP